MGQGGKGCILQVTKGHFSDQLSILASKSSGWHLSALKAESHKIEDLDLETMLCDMQCIAPDLCTFIQEMMSADRKLVARCADFEPHMPEDPSDNGCAHDEDRARERRDSLTKIVGWLHRNITL